MTDDTGGAVESTAPTSDYPATLWAEKPEAPSRLLAVLLILLIKLFLAIPHFVALFFYQLGEINPDTVVRYSKEAASIAMVRNNHYGPWHPMFVRKPILMLSEVSA